MRNKIILITAFIALSLASCSQKEDIDLSTGVLTINFATTVGEQTRSSGYLDDNNDGKGGFAVGDVIGVFGYEKQSLADWENNELPSLMYNVTLTKQSFKTSEKDSVINYVYNPQQLWPDLPNRVRFFAYYPHNSAVTTGAISPSSASYLGYPFVEVALGLTKKPIDFVTAKTDLVNKTEGIAGGNKEVLLTFAHRLSKLMFKVKASGLSAGLKDNETRKMYINQLRIKNVFNKAKYTFDDTGTDGKWSEHALQGIDATTGATIASGSVMAAISEADYKDLINPHSDTGSFLLMIPQTYDNVEFDITYTLERLNTAGGCEDRTIVTKRFPASVNWEAGQVYTYYIEFGFSDIDGGNIQLKLSVKPWEEKGYDIEMGK